MTTQPRTPTVPPNIVHRVGAQSCLNGGEAPLGDGRWSGRDNELCAPILHRLLNRLVWHGVEAQLLETSGGVDSEDGGVRHGKQGAAAIARVERRRVGDETVLAADCIMGDRFAGRGGQSALCAARKADGDDLSADLSLGRIPSQGGEFARAADGQHGNVQVRVPAKDQRLIRVASMYLHVDGPFALYNMVVRGNESGGLLYFEDEAGAGR